MRKRLVTFFIGLLICLPAQHAWAFQCASHQTDELLFRKSDSVIFIKVLSTKLITITEEGDTADLVLAKYELVESFKGSTSRFGELLELPGYGTGFVGLTPGVYYLVYIDNGVSLKGVPWVNVCTVAFSSLNPNATGTIDTLKEVRALADKLRTHKHRY